MHINLTKLDVEENSAINGQKPMLYTCMLYFRYLPALH